MRDEALAEKPLGRCFLPGGKNETVVARDGIEQHYTPLEIPLNGVFLDPRLE